MVKEKKLKKLGILLIAMFMAVGLFAENWWEKEDVEIEKTRPTTETVIKTAGNVTNVVDYNYYIVELEVKQSHFTLDLSEHAKDAMNKLTLEIPVDKDYYDSVYIGQEISNNFRMGSLLMKGSFGKWKVTVKNKYIKHK